MLLVSKVRASPNSGPHVDLLQAVCSWVFDPTIETSAWLVFAYVQTVDASYQAHPSGPIAH